MVPLFFPAPGAGVSMNEIGLSLGPAALRGPGGPLPRRSRRRRQSARRAAGAEAGSRTADRRVGDDRAGADRLVAVRCASSFFSTGLGDTHSHDCRDHLLRHRRGRDLFGKCLNIDTSRSFDDAAKRLAPDAETVYLLANPVLPHSEGEIVLASADPAAHPTIRMNYYDDPHDMKVMVAVVRRALDIAAHWPGNRKIGPVLIPPFLARKAWLS